MSDTQTGFELLQMAGRIVSMLEDSEGILDEESEALIDQWLAQSESKIGAYWAVVKRLRAESELLKAEVARMSKRKRALENAEKRINGMALELIKSRDERKIKTPQFTATISTRQRTVITDEEALLSVPEFRRESVTLDKTQISKALKAGQEVDGAKLESVDGLSWR